jgi:hypothetical protein
MGDLRLGIIGSEPNGTAERAYHLSYSSSPPAIINASYSVEFWKGEFWI